MDRIRTAIAHPFASLYVGALVVAEILNFTLLDLTTASGLWFALILIWLLVPILVLMGRRFVRQGLTGMTFKAWLGLAVSLGICGTFITLGLIYAFDHHYSERTFIFVSKSTRSDYTRYSSLHYLLTNEADDTYEAYDPTAGDWDYQGFWDHVSLGAPYRCKVLASPSLPNPEVFDCTRTAGGTGTVPDTGAAGITPPAGAAPAASKLRSVQLTLLGGGGSAKLALYLPANATVTTKDGLLEVAVGQSPVFSGYAMRGSLSAFMSTQHDSQIRHDPGGVVEGVSDTGQTWGKTIGTGYLVLTYLPLPGVTIIDMQKVMEQSSGSVSGG